MTIKNDAPKTNFAHKVKETKLSARVKKRGVTAKMIWEYKAEEVQGKGALEEFYNEYHALDAVEQNKLRAKHARRVEKEKEKKVKKKAK